MTEGDTMSQAKLLIVVLRRIINKQADQVASDCKEYIKNHAEENKDDVIHFFVNEFLIYSHNCRVGVEATLGIFECENSDCIRKELQDHIKQTANTLKSSLNKEVIR